jgi:NRPS condensation-like uncharacterized protein
MTAPSRPFGVADQLNCYFDSPAEPSNVHLEAWLPGHLDAGRLRTAVAAVLAAQPAARACRAVNSRWHPAYNWRIPPRADDDPVTVISWHAEPELDAVRRGFLATAPPLDRAPPFRLLLASGPDQDSLILNANHAAFDGHSCLVLLRMVAAAYTAGADQFETPSRAPSPTSSRTSSRTGDREADPPRSRPARAARIAPSRADRHAPGYGFRLLGWPGVPGPPAQHGSGPRPTVNDLLVAALIETVERWNAARHRRPTPVKITVPLNMRPPGHQDELGNLSAICTVTAPVPASDRDLLALVAAQTSRVKRQPPGREVGAALTAMVRIPLPAQAKRGLLRLAVRCAGTVVSDTSLVSNLGNVTDPPSFGPLVPAKIWFSTTAHMPRGLSVGAITIGGHLQLCLRYRYALLDDIAAADFADEYTRVLSSLGAGQPRILPVSGHR